MIAAVFMLSGCGKDSAENYPAPRRILAPKILAKPYSEQPAATTQAQVKKPRTYSYLSHEMDSLKLRIDSDYNQFSTTYFGSSFIIFE